MAQSADPKDPNFHYFYAVAQYKVMHSVRLFWSCHKCGTSNNTNLDAERLRRSDWKIEARCGKCHGQMVTLVDQRYTYYTPERLRQHLA